MTIEKGSTKLGKALDEKSWESLSDRYPSVAEGVVEFVDNGATPNTIRRFVLRHTGKSELAIWCEQAARYLLSKGG